MSNVVPIRPRGEDLFAPDLLKQSLYALANRAIVDLMDQQAEGYVREGLVSPTVMLVAATAMFKGTLDRPRGVGILRDLADMLERQDLKQIPWGPDHPAHRPAIQRLVDQSMPPFYDPRDDDAMMKLMADLEGEFVPAIEGLVDRYLETVETADEQILYGFLAQMLIRRYAQLDPDDAWGVIKDAALTAGLWEPE